MNVPFASAVALLLALGFKDAKGWAKAKIQKKLQGLDALVDDDTDVEDKDLSKLMDKILDNIKKEKEITVEDPEEKDDEPEAKGNGKPKGKRPEKAGGDKGPGVIGSIVEFLSAASEDKPITKKQIVEKLAKRFPDREAEAMAKTVNIQIPGRLKKDKSLDVRKADEGGGYWIEGEGEAKPKGGKKKAAAAAD